jgi:hypothetical protein
MVTSLGEPVLVGRVRSFLVLLLLLLLFVCLRGDLDIQSCQASHVM